MNSNQIKTLDELFGELTRLKHNGYCPKCKRYFKPEEIVVIHYIGRANKHVRWDEDNAQGGCVHCHALFHRFPKEHTIYMIERLGIERIERLRQKANSLTKLDYEEIKEQIKKRIKEVQ